jgi:hypothetical protein
MKKIIIGIFAFVIIAFANQINGNCLSTKLTTNLTLIRG